MSLTDFNQVKKADVKTTIPFSCKIGQTKAELFVMIESDPHGDGRGTHAHFHSGILYCPKKKIVDLPEPDRCEITDKNCPFNKSFGKSTDDPIQRKQAYAYELISSVSLIEIYGTNLIEKFLKFKGYKFASNPPNLRFLEIMKFLRAFNLLKDKTYGKLKQIKDMRDRLAHEEKPYTTINGNTLLNMASEARELASEFIHMLQKNNFKYKM